MSRRPKSKSSSTPASRKNEKFMRELLRATRGREREMVRLLGEFVRCESPSYDKAAVDRFGAMVAREWRRRGAKVEILRQRVRGNHLRVEWAPGGSGARGATRRGANRGDGQILVLGHLDTVYPLGTIRGMPFRVAGGKAWGPGTFDMKGGLVLALAAVDALRDTDALRATDASRTNGALRTAGALHASSARPGKRVVFLWTSDEEIGSETSRRLI